MIYILSPAALLTAAIVYIYLIINSTGPSRKKAVGALLGMILMFLGHFMDSLLFTTAFPDFPLAISPIVMIIGILVYSSSQLLIKYES